MNNLIFVSKTIGLECLKFHLENFSEDKNHIFVCNPNKNEIIKYLDEKKIQYVEASNFCSNQLSSMNFDWLLNLWGGVIFKKNLLDSVKNSLNIHPSYLPYGRGRDPVVWAIREAAPAGVTLHEINENVDEGDIWYQEEVPYGLPITGQELYHKVVTSCIRVFKEQWPVIRDLGVLKYPQKDNSFMTKKREDLFVDQVINYKDLSNSQKDIFLKLLAHNFGSDYSAILDINGTQFKASLKLKAIKG